MKKNDAPDNLKLWELLAPLYDLLNDQLFKKYSTVVNKIIQDINYSNNILDIATGTGTLAITLADYADLVQAIDFSTKMIDKAWTKAKVNRIQNLVFYVQNAYLLEFQPSFFDAVVCMNTLSWIAQPNTALSQIARVLKSNGLLVAPTFCHGENFLNRLSRLLIESLGFSNIQNFTFATLSQLIESFAFDILKKEPIKTPYSPLLYIVAKKR